MPMTSDIVSDQKIDDGGDGVELQQLGGRESEEDTLPAIGKLSLQSKKSVFTSNLEREQNLLEKRAVILAKLEATNDEYLDHLKEIHKEVSRSTEGAANLQRKYCSLFTDLEMKDNMWEKNSDPYEALREAVGQRHDILEELIVKAKTCVTDQSNGKPVEHLREESERLFGKLEKLNNRITALEIRCRSEQDAYAKLQELFEESVKQKDQEEGEDTMYMSKDRFQRFWKNSLGCNLDMRKVDELREDMSFWADDNKNNPVPEDKINAEIFTEFLRLKYGVGPDEALYLIRDHQTMGEFHMKERWKCCKIFLFIILWILLLYVLMNQMGGADRYWQSRGAKQILVETVWNDIQFPDINSVGLFWMYMNTILMPFAYGTQEWVPDGLGDNYRRDILDQAHVNPYVLGGIRFRQVRYETKDCESPADIEPFRCLSETEETADWTRFEGVAGIDKTFKWQSRADLDESRLFIGQTKSFKGSGYIFDFPPLADGRYCTEPEECDLCRSVDLSTEVPYQLCNATNIVNQLRNNFYIDAQTRAVFVDMNLFGPSSRLHTIVRLVFEFRFGFVYPGDYIQSWFLFLYEDNSNLISFIFFFITVLIFTGIHLHSCFRHMNILGYPCCCTHCIEEDLTPQEAKLPQRIRNYQLEKLHKDEDVQFMDVKWVGDGDVQLIVPMDGVTPLRVQQKQEIIKESVNQAISEILLKMDPDNKDVRVLSSYHDSRSTDWGGTLLKLDVSGGEEIFPEKIDQETKDERLKIIGMEIELDLQEMSEFSQVNVLTASDPGVLDWLIGHGLLTFYSSIWNSLDAVLVMLLLSYTGVHLTTHPKIDPGDYINVDEFKSFRHIHNVLSGEVTCLFIVTFLSSFKILEFLIEINRQVRLFFKMLMSSVKVLLSFFLLMFFVILTFAFSGWLIFSSEVWGFRSLAYTIFNLIRWTVSDLPYEEIVDASTLGTIYYFAWVFTMTLILLNVFLAILLNAWDTVIKESENEKKSKAWFPHIAYFQAWVPSIPCVPKWCQCCCKGSPHETTDPRADWLEEPAQWRRVYPAGCPDRRLKDYLQNQLELDDEDADEIISLIDIDKSGTIDWNELSIVLMELKPNIENRTFVMRRRQTQQILESQGKIQQELRDLEEEYEKNYEGDGSINSRLNNIEELCTKLVYKS